MSDDKLDRIEAKVDRLETVDSKLDKIDAKVDKLDARIDRIDITLVSQHLTLEEHTKRSTALEAQIRPIQKWQDTADGALKLIGFIAAVCGIVECLLFLFRR
jgi:ribosome-associated translation inhibitor RaiA